MRLEFCGCDAVTSNHTAPRQMNGCICLGWGFDALHEMKSKNQLVELIIFDSSLLPRFEDVYSHEMQKYKTHEHTQIYTETHETAKTKKEEKKKKNTKNVKKSQHIMRVQQRTFSTENGDASSDH